MITSEDVRHVTFDRAMRGYRCDDVDDYLKQVADSMDALMAANEEQQKKLVLLAQSVAQYRADEDVLRTALLNAQRMGDNVINEAKQNAAEIIRSAKMKAEDRERSANDEVELARQQIITLKKEADAFKKNLLELYSKHIKLLSKIPEYTEDAPQPAEPQQMTPAPEPVYQQPAYQPAPAPEPAYQQPVYQPAPVQEPVYQQPEPGYQEPVYQEPAYQEPVYPEPTAYYEQPVEAPQEDRVDTVEFALSPSAGAASAVAAAPAAAAPDPAEEVPDTRFAAPVADLFSTEDPPAAPKKTVRSKKARAKKAAPAPAGDLPEAFSKFDDLGYEV